LPASKNGSISPSHLEKGWLCEQAALFAYQRHGYRLCGQRWRTPFAEIDLCFHSPEGGWVMVEVKSSPSLEYTAQRVSVRQKNRLKRAFLWAIENWGPGEFHLAVVTAKAENATCKNKRVFEVLIFNEIFD
jgi:putative endonuclease